MHTPTTFFYSGKTEWFKMFFFPKAKDKIPLTTPLLAPQLQIEKLTRHIETSEGTDIIQHCS